MKLSIIIPIYNSAQYLARCLESLLVIKCEECEILCINDGSTDNSLDVLNNYQKLDKRIKIFSKQNGGVSSARNYGLDQAKGEYIMFVDSDDIIENNYVSELMEYTDKYDIIKTGYKNDTIPITWFSKEQEITMQDFFYYIKKDNRFNVVFAQLIKRSILTNIRFKEDISYGEDLLFNYECYSNASSIGAIPKYGYVMTTDNTNSITRVMHFDKVKRRIDDTFYVFNFFPTDLFSSIEKNTMITKKININLKNYVQSSNSNYREFKTAFNEPKIKEVLKSPIDDSLIGSKNILLIKLLKKQIYRLYYIIIKMKRMIKHD